MRSRGRPPVVRCSLCQSADFHDHPPYCAAMDRRHFLLAALTGALAAPFAAEAQPAEKVYRIGFLPFSMCPARPYDNDLRSALRTLGYVEGRNVVIECRAAAGQGDRLSDAAAELVRLKLDVLVAQGTPSALAAQRATATTPIVFVTVGEPVSSGLVSTLARPGKNVTGDPPPMWTRSSRAPGPPTSPSSSRPSSSWSSTSRPPRPSASRSRRRCWRGPDQVLD
jgi:hypothetical protein